jgi:hypothetical protein
MFAGTPQEGFYAYRFLSIFFQSIGNWDKGSVDIANLEHRIVQWDGVLFS